MRYGVAGSGNFNQKKVDNLLKLAVSNNINSIDTAPGYGDAHLKIGKSEVKNLNIITKLPKLNLSAIRSYLSNLSRLFYWMLY